MLSEMLAPKRGHRDEHSEAVLVMAPYEATFIGVLPDRKTGAGGPPCVHHLRIRPRFSSDPFEQIEYQSFYRIRQRGLSSGDLLLKFRVVGIVMVSIRL
jgi:hypothetical protein